MDWRIAERRMVGRKVEPVAVVQLNRAQLEAVTAALDRHVEETGDAGVEETNVAAMATDLHAALAALGVKARARR